jgi:(R,R)-butanediol dehydrogenase/meso-butanediol dehydrogenase/diacetyl reductase
MTHVEAAQITGAGTLELQSFPDGAPAPGCVRVDVHLCGICGTEITSFRSGALHHPSVCGHEWMGTVSAIGADVRLVSEGDRVVVSVPPPCGSCAECVRGLTEHCALVNLTGRGRDPLAPSHGAFARSITVSAGRVLAAEPSLSDEQLAFVEPTSVALHGVRRSRIALGDVVVVQGAGPIGLLALQLSRAAGAGRLVVLEPSELRRRHAVALGADLVLAPGEEAEELLLQETRGLGADVVLECAGVPALLQKAADLTRIGGVVSLLSYIAAPVTINAARWLGRELTLVGSNAFTRDDVVRAMGFLADGRVQVTPMHTRTIGLAGLADTLAALAAGSTDDVKVLVDPRL